jgi:hypothetical protein
MGKQLAVSRAVLKKVAVATRERGDPRATPQRKWPLYDQLRMILLGCYSIHTSYSLTRAAIVSTPLT